MIVRYLFITSQFWLAFAELTPYAILSTKIRSLNRALPGACLAKVMTFVNLDVEGEDTGAAVTIYTSTALMAMTAVVFSSYNDGTLVLPGDMSKWPIQYI